MRLTILISLLCLFAFMTRVAADEATETALKNELGAGFHVRGAGIFVCAGDLDESAFDVIIDKTVVPCANALWKQYFVKRPTIPIRIYLFNSEKTYRAYAKSLFGDTNVSYFGYYKPDKHALVMNISTGTGTLVHEMVHALMAPDFPNAPTWFSEGLASLYEQCQVSPDGLTGLTNWRLPILQKALKDKTTLSLPRLIATNREEFLDQHAGIHYAQARYFCFFMQDRGVLRDFYRSFRDNYKADPTGRKMIQQVFRGRLSGIERDWLSWTTQL
ncbi:MAG: hypothetical protein ACYDBB_14200 [Armatimonadota bacterium]